MLWRTDDGITNETMRIASYSYRELVRKFAAALELHGLQPGHRVAGSFFGLVSVTFASPMSSSHAPQPLLQTEQH